MGGGQKKGGGGTRRQGPRHTRPENAQSKRQRGGGVGKKNKKKRGGDKTPRPKAPGAGKHAKQDTTGAQRGREPNNNHKRGKPSPEGAAQAKSAPRTAKGKVRRTRTRPGGRPARPGQESTHTHIRAGPGRGVLRPERGGVGVHKKQPRCTGRVPRRKTDGTGNRTRQ